MRRIVIFLLSGVAGMIISATTASAQMNPSQGFGFGGGFPGGGNLGAGNIGVGDFGSGVRVGNLRGSNVFAQPGTMNGSGGFGFNNGLGASGFPNAGGFGGTGSPAAGGFSSPGGFYNPGQGTVNQLPGVSSLIQKAAIKPQMGRSYSRTGGRRR